MLKNKYDEKINLKHYYMNKTQIGGGSADLFCVLCGGPTYSKEVITNTKLFKKLCHGIYHHIYIDMDNEDVIKMIKKYNKKEIIDINEVKQMMNSINKPKNHKWLNNLLLITKKRIIKKVISSGEYFVEKDNSKIEVDPNFTDDWGYIMHCDCYKLLESKYGKFTFNDIDEKKYIKNYPNLFNINYGIIKKYQEQEFNNNLAYVENPYLLESPLKNNSNKERILNLKLPIIKHIKESKKDRPSPSESATLFNIGFKKKGNDGNIWIIKENKNGVKKWSKINLK